MWCSSGSGAGDTEPAPRLSQPPAGRPGVQGAIVAGGRASRFDQRPKGLERVGGVRLIDRVVAAFEEAFHQAPLLIANAPEAAGWRPGLRVVPDVRPGLGALGGILTACLEAPAPVVIAAWDMPFLSPRLLWELGARLAGHDACLPESGGPRGLEPLCAAYGPGSVAAIEDSASRGDLRAIGFHQRIKVGILPRAEVARFGDPARLFFNVNTADDLTEAEALWRQHASSRSSD
jgi:molybdopterin-guanine dinucleotide biosynthesis protein A